MAQFSDKIAGFSKQVQKRYRAVARMSVDDTASLAQRVRRKGGRMRVDTGFLRASIQGNINAMPSGPTTNENDAEYAEGVQVDGEPLAVTILKWDPLKMDVLYIGWTANYARPREHKDGFLMGAVEVWDRTVKKAVNKVKASGL